MKERKKVALKEREGVYGYGLGTVNMESKTIENERGKERKKQNKIEYYQVMFRLLVLVIEYIIPIKIQGSTKNKFFQ
jgi:hypothetical protein